MKIAKIALFCDHCRLRQAFLNNILGNEKYLQAINEYSQAT